MCVWSRWDLLKTLKHMIQTYRGIMCRNAAHTTQLPQLHTRMDQSNSTTSYPGSNVDPRNSISHNSEAAEQQAGHITGRKTAHEDFGLSCSGRVR